LPSLQRCAVNVTSRGLNDSNIYADRLASMALKERYSQEELEAKDPKEVSEEFYKLKVHALNTTSLLTFTIPFIY
jgi:hypothetical protein